MRGNCDADRVFVQGTLKEASGAGPREQVRSGRGGRSLCGTFTPSRCWLRFLWTAWIHTLILLLCTLWIGPLSYYCILVHKWDWIRKVGKKTNLTEEENDLESENLKPDLESRLHHLLLGNSLTKCNFSFFTWKCNSWHTRPPPKPTLIRWNSVCESPLTAPMLHQAAASVNLSVCFCSRNRKTQIWTKRVFNNDV